MSFDQKLYKLLEFNFHFNNLNKEISALNEFLKKNNVKVKSAIDVACGDGHVTEKLRKILEIKEISGLDLNKELLSKAKKRKVVPICADMDKIKSNKKYDVVITFGSLHHSPDTVNLIKNLKKLSNKYVLIVDNTVRNTLFHKITGSKRFILESSSYHIRSEKEIKDSLKKAGLKLVSSKTIKNGNIWHDRSFFLAKL